MDHRYIRTIPYIEILAQNPKQLRESIIVITGNMITLKLNCNSKENHLERRINFLTQQLIDGKIEPKKFLKKINAMEKKKLKPFVQVRPHERRKEMPHITGKCRVCKDISTNHLTFNQEQEVTLNQNDVKKLILNRNKSTTDMKPSAEIEDVVEKKVRKFFTDYIELTQSNKPLKEIKEEGTLLTKKLFDENITVDEVFQKIEQIRKTESGPFLKKILEVSIEILTSTNRAIYIFN